jgi:ribosomal protein S18 acetylase RimI-like enzyme
MLQIIPCQDRFEELVQFAVRLNSEGAHHIGFFGEGEADVRASLEECVIPSAEGFLLAYENDTLVGVFGVDADPEVDRAWLFGPLVDHGDWYALADELYNRVLPLIPAGIHSYDLFCDEQNNRLDEFAVRHGFPLHSENAVMALACSNYKPSAKRVTKIIPFEENLFAAFEQLHNAVFPGTYFTARQIVEKLDESHQLLLAMEGNCLLGYHYGKIDPAAESGYVDFIGTDESARGRGVGADLLAAGVDWMLSAPTTQKVSLTVNANNHIARGLYEKFGFVTERVMRGYRKQIDISRDGTS